MRKEKTTEGNLAFKRSRCPITNALDIFGDKWSLLIIRDLVIGKRRSQEFLSSPERIATNILLDRLKKLEATGLITRRLYQQKPARYECFLTHKGKSLQPVMDTIIAWSKNNIPGTQESSRYLAAIRSQTRSKQNMNRHAK